MKRRGLEMLPEMTLRTGDLKLMGEGRDFSKIHLSEILKEMKRQAGENVEAIGGETEGLRAQMGFLFERALEHVWKEYWHEERPHVITQLHLEHDGILMTPDGFDKENHRLESYKLTWKSARKWDEDIEKYFWAWLMQEKSYAWALSHHIGDPVLEVLYWVGFMMGDYKGPWRLGVWTDVITFELAELEENWANVMRYKQWIEEQRRQENG